MIIPLILFTLLYLAGSIYLFTKSLNKKWRSLKLAITILILPMLYLIVFQPSFDTQVIKPADNRPLLLIDNSLSMREFNSENILEMFSNKINDKCVVVLFGGEKREADLVEISFNDSTSHFPKSPFLKNHNGPVILLTDGLFSNTIEEDLQSKAKSTYFIPLERVQYQNFITFDAPEIAKSKYGNPLEIPISFSGYHSDSLARFSFFIYNSNKKIFSQKLNPSNGIFSFDRIFKLQSLPEGRSILDLIITKNGNEIQRHELLAITEPKTLNISIDDTIPSLDLRFLKLAIQKDEDLTIDPQKPAHINITNKIKSNHSKITLQIGQSNQRDKSHNFGRSEVIVKSESSHFYNIKSLPLPQLIYEPIRKTGSSVISLSDNKNKNIPILTKKVFKNSTRINLLVKGFWKWEFKDGKNFEFKEVSFLYNLLSYLKENALNSSYRSPLIQKVNNNRVPRAFRIHHPFLQNPSNKDSATIEICNKSGDLIGRRSKKLNTILSSDTILVSENFNDTTILNIQIKYLNKTFDIEKTIIPENLNIESSFSNQNRLLLERYYKKLNIEDSTQLQSILEVNNSNAKQDYFTMQIKLNRTWLILLITIFLLCIFWIIKEDS